MKMIAKKEGNEYNDERRKDETEFGENKLFLKPDNIDIQLTTNGDGNNAGYIKCKVEGYLILNIKSKEFSQILNNKLN